MKEKVCYHATGEYILHQHVVVCRIVPISLYGSRSEVNGIQEAPNYISGKIGRNLLVGLGNKTTDLLQA